MKLNLELWSNDQFNYGDNKHIYQRGSCPLLIESTMFLFGGDSETRQIIEIYPWVSSITRQIHTLPFTHYKGTCNYHSGVVYLCFDLYEPRVCRSR